MSKSRHAGDAGVLVRFWSLDHYGPEEIPWPRSPWSKLVYAEGGVLQVELDQRLHWVTTNRALLVPAGETHRARTLGKAKVRTLYLSPDLEILSRSCTLEVRPIFRELIAEACRVGPLLAARGRDQAITTLLVQEIQQAPEVATNIPMPVSPWLREWALRFLDEPSMDPPFSYSARTVERRILAETSLTLGQWRQQAKALRGLRELSLGATVLEAAIAAGFESSSGFIQSFKKQLGDTPARVARGLRKASDS